MKYKLFAALALLCLIVGNSNVSSAGPNDRNDVETSVHGYFMRLMAYDYAGMRAMAAPTFETLDYGVRLNHSEFEDYVRNTAEAFGIKLDMEASQFNTQISGDIAYTSFLLQYGGGDHPSAMVLKRSGKQWLIERFFHSGVNNMPEAVVRQFYHHLMAGNHKGMKSMATPGFRIVKDGSARDWSSFEEQQRSKAGPQTTEYRLSEFKMNPMGEELQLEFRETNYENDKKGTSRLNSFTLQRSHIKAQMGETLWRVYHINVGAAANGTNK